MGKPNAPCAEHPDNEATYCGACVDEIEKHATEVSRGYTIEEFVVEAERRVKEDGMASIYITVVRDIAKSIKEAYEEEKPPSQEGE